jgi:GNAT superfamily N-acetyltransferase
MVSEGLSLVPATAADADAVRCLTRDAYAKWVLLIGREPLPMLADYAAAVRDHRIDLVYRDGILVGLIEMIPESDHLLIENVAVSPAFQGQGLGRGWRMPSRLLGCWDIGRCGFIPIRLLPRMSGFIRSWGIGLIGRRRSWADSPPT